MQTQANNGEEAESTIIIRLDDTDEKHNGARKVEQESDEPADRSLSENTTNQPADEQRNADEKKKMSELGVHAVLRPRGPNPSSRANEAATVGLDYS